MPILWPYWALIHTSIENWICLAKVFKSLSFEFYFYNVLSLPLCEFLWHLSSDKSLGLVSKLFVMWILGGCHYPNHFFWVSIFHLKLPENENISFQIYLWGKAQGHLCSGVLTFEAERREPLTWWKITHLFPIVLFSWSIYFCS